MVRWPSGLRRHVKVFKTLNLIIRGPKGRGFESHSHQLLFSFFPFRSPCQDVRREASSLSALFAAKTIFPAALSMWKFVGQGGCWIVSVELGELGYMAIAALQSFGYSTRALRDRDINTALFLSVLDLQ